jgi:hypothetical protein
VKTEFYGRYAVPYEDEKDRRERRRLQVTFKPQTTAAGFGVTG